MGYNEKSYLNEEERKKHEKTDRQEQAEMQKIAEFQKTKEIIHEEEHTSEDLSSLKELLDKKIVDQELIEKVVTKEEINEDEIQEIFEKIDAIEDVQNIDNYLPADLRITKNEYKQAVTDDIFRVQAITKLNSALTLLSEQAVPNAATGLNLFSGFLTMLDKNLVTIQEHHIDIKDHLVAINETKNPSPKKSLWEKIKAFITELLS